MYHNADDQHGAEEILCISGNVIEPVDDKAVNEDQGNRSEEPQLLTDDGENHVILGLRNQEFLNGFAQSLAEDAPGADGIESLNGLIGIVNVVGRIPPGEDSGQLVFMQNVCAGQQLCQRIRTYINSNNDKTKKYEKLVMPAGNEQHNAGDSQDDECRRQIGQCGKKEGRRTIAKGKNPNIPVIQSAAQLIYFCRQHNDDHRLHDLRGLKAHTEKIDPARRAMGAETDQHGQNNGNPCQNI